MGSLELEFEKVYTKFKLQFYKRVFGRFESREASLTAVETFCVEVIHALGEPTVNEFAKFVNISQANAAYRVQNLIEKDYVRKVRSENDRREYHLCITERFFEYQRMSTEYIETVLSRVRARFPDTEVEKLREILRIMDDELMPEIAT